MYVLVQLRNRLRVVPLSLSPLCVMRKKTLQKKNGRTASWEQGARERSAFHSKDFTQPFYLRVFLKSCLTDLVKERLLIA